MNPSTDTERKDAPQKTLPARADVKKVKKKKKKKSVPFSTVLEMFFSVLLIPVGLASATYADRSKPFGIVVLLMMIALILLGLSVFFRAVVARYRFQVRERRTVDFIRAAVYIASGITLANIELDPMALGAAVAVYLLTLIPGRVLAILRNRKWSRILINVLLILFTLIMAMACYETPEGQREVAVLLLIILAFASLFRIMSVSFSRLRMDRLREIVQQTYAAEIIAGLFLLIASFSFVMLYTDSASFNDDYGNALWYNFAVVTTIGFGDITVTSFIGRVLTVILGIYGIIVVALITSIIVNFYGEMKKVRPEDAEPEEESGPDVSSGPKEDSDSEASAPEKDAGSEPEA